MTWWILWEAKIRFVFWEGEKTGEHQRWGLSYRGHYEVLS